MIRAAFVAGCVFALATAVLGQTCDLSNPNSFSIPMCSGPIASGGKSTCSFTITNLGANPCTGSWSGAIGPLDPGTVSSSSASSPPWVCSIATNVAFPTPVDGHPSIPSAASCQGSLTLAPGATLSISGDVTPSTSFAGQFFEVGYVAHFQNSQTGGTFKADSWGSAFITIQNCTAIPSAPGAAPSAVPYVISWNATADGGPYQVQEATLPDFSNATTITEPSTAHAFQHTVSAATTFYYRVRPQSCSGSAGSYGPSAQIVVLPPQSPTSRDFDVVVPIGTTAQVSQTVTFSNLPPNAAYTVSTDQAFLTVTPASGNVKSDGTVTVTVKGSPGGLPAGANTGTIAINVAGGKRGIIASDSRTTSTTVSISLTAPVNSNPKGAPPNDALIVPAVAHLEGAASFRSDVRITNTGAATATYLLSFTPQNNDGTQSGKQTTISVAAGQTVALNDILRDYFGFADPSAQAGGVLDIRVTSGSAATTFVSSRTYAATPSGTYGQFVPAVPVSKFLKQGAGSLTLTQVSQFDKFRTNLGLVEGLGASANVRIRVFAASGLSLGEFTLDSPLKPFEFRQLNAFLASKQITVPDARIEVINDSPGAGVTTYASVLDNTTQDPLLVSPIQQANLSANRYVLPGMADFASQISNFHSDVRIYNGSPFTVNATATFYPQGNGTPLSQNITILPGEIKVYNNVLPTLFGTSGGGAIVVTTPNNVPLIVSGRTYSNADSGGTFGQFIPAVTPADGIGNGDSPLQVLQLEQSANFRSNVGLNELTGNPVTVRVTLIPPGSKEAAVLPDITLAPNEFRQLNSVFLQAFAGQNVYNGRATVTVVGGAGRVTAYGSVVDNLTSDPTYVPAQK